VLINKAMAEKFWPGKDPIGRKLWPSYDASRQLEVIGIVGNIRSFGLASNVRCEVYRSIEQSPWDAMTVVIRTKNNDPRKIMPVARQILASIDPALPVSNVQTLEDVVSASVSQPRLMSALSGLFGALAGLLSMVGIYSVMAYNVRRQRREFGVRIALGAGRDDISNMVIRRGLQLVLLGTIIGSLGAWIFAGLLKSMLMDVKPTDPLIFAGTVFVVILVGLLASYLPARAAARIDPMITLKDE